MTRIFSVVESPAQKDLIWAGSDDGLIHITKNGGQNWDNITPKSMPEWGTVSMIEASLTDSGTAYVAVERHKMDDFTPYIFKTTDFGKSWTTLVNGIPEDDYVHAVRIDPKRKGLLYAGTERGVYVTFDDGANWQPLQLNLAHGARQRFDRKGNDLAVATHGRSFWVLDDLSPVRQWNEGLKTNDVHLFTPAEANHTTFSGSFFGPSGAAGQNPPAGAAIYYYLKTEIKKPEEKKDEKKKEDGVATRGPCPRSGFARSNPPGENKTESRIKIEILDSSGKVIRTYPCQKSARTRSRRRGSVAQSPKNSPPKRESTASSGICAMKARRAFRIRRSGEALTDGPLALPGAYQVRLTVDGKITNPALQGRS